MALCRHAVKFELQTTLSYLKPKSAFENIGINIEGLTGNLTKKYDTVLDGLQSRL